MVVRSTCTHAHGTHHSLFEGVSMSGFQSHKPISPSWLLQFWMMFHLWIKQYHLDWNPRFQTKCMNKSFKRGLRNTWWNQWGWREVIVHRWVLDAALYHCGCNFDKSVRLYALSQSISICQEPKITSDPGNPLWIAHTHQSKRCWRGTIIHQCCLA